MFFIDCLSVQYRDFTILQMDHAPYCCAGKSLARPTSRCILFDGENISFDVSLVIYTNSTNISPIMITNRKYEYRNLVAVACFLPGQAKHLSAPLYSLYITPSDFKSVRIS